MTREEILEKSRTENKNQDIYDLEVQSKAARLAIYVTAILCCVLIVALGIITKRIPFEIVMILCAMEATLFTVKFVKMHKKHELLVAIIYALGFLASTAVFIKQLIA